MGRFSHTFLLCSSRAVIVRLLSKSIASILDWNLLLQTKFLHLKIRIPHLKICLTQMYESDILTIVVYGKAKPLLSPFRRAGNASRKSLRANG